MIKNVDFFNVQTNIHLYIYISKVNLIKHS